MQACAPPSFAARHPWVSTAQRRLAGALAEGQHRTPSRYSLNHGAAPTQPRDRRPGRALAAAAARFPGRRLRRPRPCLAPPQRAAASSACVGSAAIVSCRTRGRQECGPGGSRCHDSSAPASLCSDNAPGLPLGLEAASGPYHLAAACHHRLASPAWFSRLQCLPPPRAAEDQHHHCPLSQPLPLPLLPCCWNPRKSVPPLP